MDVDDPSPLGRVLELLIGSLDETAEVQEGGHTIVERMLVELPLELYVRYAEETVGVVVDGRTAERTLTTFAPVLHRVKMRVEVAGAGGFEPGLES